MALNAALMAVAIRVAVVCVAVVSATLNANGEPVTRAAVTVTARLPFEVAPEAATTVAVSTCGIGVVPIVATPVTVLIVRVSELVASVALTQ